MNNDIDALRQHLFETLAALRDKDAPMDLDRAHMVAEIAGKIIETAKVEVNFIRETGAVGSGFLVDRPQGMRRIDGTKAGKQS